MKRASDVKKCSAIGDVKNASPQGQEKKRAALTKIAAAIFVAAFGAKKNREGVQGQFASSLSKGVQKPEVFFLRLYKNREKRFL